MDLFHLGQSYFWDQVRIVDLDICFFPKLIFTRGILNFFTFPRLNSRRFTTKIRLTLICRASFLLEILKIRLRMGTKREGENKDSRGSSQIHLLNFYSRYVILVKILD